MEALWYIILGVALGLVRPTSTTDRHRYGWQKRHWQPTPRPTPLPIPYPIPADEPDSWEYEDDRYSDSSDEFRGNSPYYGVKTSTSVSVWNRRAVPGTTPPSVSTGKPRPSTGDDGNYKPGWSTTHTGDGPVQPTPMVSPKSPNGRGNACFCVLLFICFLIVFLGYFCLFGVRPRVINQTG